MKLLFKQEESDCSKHRKWSVFCLLIVFGVVGFTIHVAYRNTKAARIRREAPLPPIKDVSNSPFRFTTNRLPVNEKLMCSVGNGHLATNVFSDTVYMNGIYNGAGGESHRARIPSWINLRLNSTLVVQTPGMTRRPVYTLDTRDGVFIVHVDREYSIVEQRIYAHRYYTKAIVNQILITAKHRAEIHRDYHARYVDLSFLPGPESKDIDFEEPTVIKIHERVVFSSCGKTKTMEDPRYQDIKTPVCVYWTYAPSRLVVPRRGKVLHTFVMTVDSEKHVALKELSDVLQLEGDELFEKHIEEWRRINSEANVQIFGNLEIAKVVNAAWYYLRSSLPWPRTNQPSGLFYGLSPGSLARGGLYEDYEGHNFWDTEIWMFPTILLLHPDQAKELLDYRMTMAGAAFDLANSTNNTGTRYPWESAFTGREVTQPCCPEVAIFEHHITGCIAFAARQYLALAADKEWLYDGGCSLIYEMAEFWASRATYNNITGFHDIKNVMGPDEDHSNITNSVFTNVVAGYSLYLGQYAKCLCDSPTREKGNKWGEIASNLYLEYDPINDYHPQFSGYEKSTRIKQADAILLGFPLQYKMNQSTMANDLKYYENVTRSTGPAMTWSMHSIGHIKLGETEKAEELFNKSYQGYVREPFKVWSEYRKPLVGAVNFLTGMGGFMQTIIFGYAGLRIHLDKLEIVNPQVIPGSERLKIQGFKFRGTSLTLDIFKSNVTLNVLDTDQDRPTVIVIKNNKIPLAKGNIVTLYGEGPFEIRESAENKCPLPLDLIGQISHRKVGNQKPRRHKP